MQAYGFVQFEDEILKYGTDGVSLVNQKEETVWSEDFQMTNPTVDVCENMAVVADKDATSLYILSKEKGGWNGSDIQADFKSKSGENRSCCCNFTG